MLHCRKVFFTETVASRDRWLHKQQAANEMLDRYAVEFIENLLMKTTNEGSAWFKKMSLAAYTPANFRFNTPAALV